MREFLPAFTRKITKKMNLSHTINTIRREAVELLLAYLQNPGRFSILILGNAGVGKSHWVREIQKAIQGQTPCAKGVVEVSLRAAEPTRVYWQNILEEAHGKILLLKELECIKPHENLLYEALSTSDGKYGFEAKETETRVVFTSRYAVSALRHTEDLIAHRLFDRISQLVVRFPSFEEASRGIWEDFKTTWSKMNFQQNQELPGQALQKWLESGSHKLHGNFRDLDKIAILWHQFRLMKKDEKDILAEMLKQFEGYSSFPEQHTDVSDAFCFEQGKTKKQIEDEFRAAFKRWAITTYGSLRKAAKPLDMSHRTMEKW